MKIDRVDLKILDILEENSRTSFRKIAKDLGLTPMAVVKRVRKLENLGIIKRYTIISDPDRLGYQCNFFILIRVKPGYNAEDIGKIIAGFQETYIVNVMIGEYDLSVITRCRDRENIKNYISRINNIEGVERVVPYFIVKTLV